MASHVPSLSQFCIIEIKAQKELPQNKSTKQNERNQKETKEIYTVFHFIPNTTQSN